MESNMTDKPSILIIDYNIGNVASISNMLQYLGEECHLSSDLEQIKKAKKIILPGVGAFDAAMSILRDTGIDKALQEAVDNGAYLFGICLGSQLLMESSEEGKMPGLGFVKGKVVKFQLEDSSLKVPHMGWNLVHPTQDSSLFSPEIDEHRFYFAHSFFMKCENARDIAAECEYGLRFTCAVESGNILGVQFHPEKSHKFGLKLFERFVGLPC